VIDRNEIVLSTHDAATLSAVLATFSTREAPQHGAAEELAEILAGARLVAHNAIDGDIGHLVDYLIDGDSWQIVSIVADTKNWFSGKKVVLPVSDFERIDWYNRLARTRLTREEIKSAPEFSSVEAAHEA